MKNRTNKETVQGLLDNTWDSVPPEFYLTLHWRNSPKQLETVIKDTKFFNNIFFQRFEGTSKPKKIPKFPKRVGFQHFHERKGIHLKLTSNQRHSQRLALSLYQEVY